LNRADRFVTVSYIKDTKNAYAVKVKLAGVEYKVLISHLNPSDSPTATVDCKTTLSRKLRDEIKKAAIAFHLGLDLTDFN